MPFVLVLLLFTYQANPHFSSQKASVQNGATQQKQQNAFSAPRKPGGPVAAESPNRHKEEAPHAEDKQANAYDPRRDSLYRGYLISTIIGVCGGIIGLVILICQTIATRKAAEGAQGSANAALLSARAIINAERPWMFIEIKTIAHGATPIGDVPAHISFSIRFRNRGKTPAEIIGFEEHPECRQSTDDLPPSPQYRAQGEVLMHTRMVPPGEVWDEIMTYTPAELFSAGGHWNDIRASRRRLIYWGRLQYRDLVEQAKTVHELDRSKPITIHETCFCYFWSPRLNEFLITGPLGYNKHT